MKLRSVLLGSLLLLTACGAGHGPLVLSMRAGDWGMDPFTNYFPGNPGNANVLHPTQAGSGWALDLPVEANFPACAQNSGSFSGCFLVGYVETPYSGPAQHQVSMTFRVDITGSPTFNYGLDPGNPNLPNNPSADAAVTILIQEQDDDWASDFKRWWATGDKVFLAPGTFAVTVPLTVDRWNGDITGASYTQAQQQAAFVHTLKNLGHVGVTFGGGCCAGHGVDVTGGTVRFVLLSYSIS